MKEKYLPIGTVCRLKDGQKKLMIIGFCQSSTENINEVYDYNGCMYPEGFLSPDVNFLFNHDQIEEIVYMGLINSEELEFKKNLKEFLETGKIDGKEIHVDKNGKVTLGDTKEELDSVSNKTQIVNDTLNTVQFSQTNESISPMQNESANNTTMSQIQKPTMQSNFSTLNLNDLNVK